MTKNTIHWENCDKDSTWIISLNFHINPRKLGLLLCPLSRCGNRGLKRLWNLPRVKRQVCVAAGIWIPAWPWNLSLYPPPHNASSETTNCISPFLCRFKLNAPFRTNTSNLGHETSPKQPRPLYSFLPLSPADNHIHPFLQSQWCLLCIMYCANLKTCCALWQFLYIYRKGGNCGL